MTLIENIDGWATDANEIENVKGLNPYFETSGCKIKHSQILGGKI